MLTARSYWCVGRVVVRSLYEELARSYALCFRELGMAENHAPTLRHYLLQDLAYSYRVWITLIKLLYASVWSPRIHPDIHQGERLYGSLLPSVPLVSEKNSSRKPRRKKRACHCYPIPRCSLGAILAALGAREERPENVRGESPRKF